MSSPNSNPNNCSIALQILPLGAEERIDIIDKVIAYLDSTGKNLVVSPFESVLEGDFDELMLILKEAVRLAGTDHQNIFANVKIHYGKILSTEEKLLKFR